MASLVSAYGFSQAVQSLTTTDEPVSGLSSYWSSVVSAVRMYPRGSRVNRSEAKGMWFDNALVSREVGNIQGLTERSKSPVPEISDYQQPFSIRYAFYALK
jgi:hypothetical protein